jgi:hypothetical protein
MPVSAKGVATQRSWLSKLARELRAYQEHAEPELTLDAEVPEQLADSENMVAVGTVDDVAAYLIEHYTSDELDRLFDLLTQPAPSPLPE